MKRMSELKDNLRGVKCDATKKAFRYLKRQGRKPRLDEPSPLIYYIRVQIDGQRYDYYAASGSWAVTRVRGKPGRWMNASSVADFYSMAMERSAIRNSDEATEKQKGLIKSLLEQTEAEPTEGATESKEGASDEIERLLRIKAAQKKGYYRKDPEPYIAHKFRVSPQEWQAVLFLCERQKQMKSTSISEIAIRLGTDKFRATTIVNTLKAKRIIGGISSSIWLFGSYNTTHSAKGM